MAKARDESKRLADIPYSARSRLVSCKIWLVWFNRRNTDLFI
jgi:hypothetical protein